MSKHFRTAFFSFVVTVLSLAPAHAASAASSNAEKGSTLWQLIAAGGICMIFLGLMSVATVALAIYHFLYVRAEKLVPQELTENVLSLLDRREYEKAKQVCLQQPTLISAITLKGLEKAARGPVVVEDAIQHEGKARIERMWQNLTYLGDLAVISPMVGLLGTIIGMIEAFSYFKAGSINPSVLTQGLAKAMINTAAGLIIAVPALAFYSFFRGRLSSITSTAENAASEIAQVMTKERA
jgi:biopolymer transport protein ExbB